ncbi:unnamed protein product [Ectocarpus sp. CCAP 1310/34]|nr:unnamed protein product [Ectocarpus sp. CCAP 1310/34]
MNHSRARGFSSSAGAVAGTKYQSYGAAYGKGIYMAEALSVSLKYAGMSSNGEGSGNHWPLSSIDGSAVIVAGAKSSTSGSWFHTACVDGWALCGLFSR